MATSRLVIRQDVGTTLGDMQVLEATAEGTTTELTDANNLVLPTNEYKGRTIWFYDGTADNLGSSRKINASSGSSVQWGVGLPAITAVGDKAELWNLRGTGWEPQEINRLIAVAHRELNEHLPVRIESDEFTWDGDEPFLTIPETMVAVTGIRWQEPNTENWRTVPRAVRPRSPGYWVDKAARTLHIAGLHQYGINERTVTLQGYIRESALEADDDETVINREALVARVCELACAALLTRTPEPGLIRDKLQMYKGDAQFKRTLAIGRRPLNVDRLD